MLQDRTQTIFVIDDDPDVRESLQWLLESVGLQVCTYATALDFLAQCPEDAAGCIVMDVRMPGLSGINAQKKLSEQQINLPVIMISAHGSIDMAVTAMTQGALTFIEKPFDDQTLIDHVQTALEQNSHHRQKQKVIAEYRTRFNGLTKREHQVFEQVVKGLSNQEIADVLGINRKTVEGHRANMMVKMAVSSLSELVEIGISLRMDDQ
ncbi:two component transcriptional regulator, LuxR family [Oceanospirillum multiglobuliferum]|uniref:DNA-binding response regulator n=1 Tax=Oceanospirillum multiglobuliferum TaxID=64969 RepID=A0A1T4KEC5_9GAMM|nr:response regulator [Oceanospirillum multiglobuliferum]OPX56007.1 DNA-binding response regulator [Oceanospirillum multiglobuliferum]SJZ40774.1 two component transcriptional regulator, LuxR family [Oceanospirillum multiglobuliferum]